MCGGHSTTFFGRHKSLAFSPPPSKQTFELKNLFGSGGYGGNIYRWTTEIKVNLSTGQVTHSFLMVPECSYPLLDRDLLSKLGEQIHFSENRASVTDNTGQALQILSLRLENEHRLFELLPLPGGCPLRTNGSMISPRSG